MNSEWETHWALAWYLCTTFFLWKMVYCTLKLSFFSLCMSHSRKGQSRLSLSIGHRYACRTPLRFAEGWGWKWWWSATDVRSGRRWGRWWDWAHCRIRWFREARYQGHLSSGYWKTGNVALCWRERQSLGEKTPIACHDNANRQSWERHALKHSI